MASLKNIRKFNSAITMRVIDLHHKGYTNDFMPVQGQHYLCLQDSEDFAVEDLTIQVIYQAFDRKTQTTKYIHTIETSNGYKGLLLSDVNCCGEGMLAN